MLLLTSRVPPVAEVDEKDKNKSSRWRSIF